MTAITLVLYHKGSLAVGYRLFSPVIDIFAELGAMLC